MSNWRNDIPELSLLTAINLLVDGLTTSTAQIDFIKKQLNEQILDLEIELEDLIEEKDNLQLFVKKQQRKSLISDLRNQTDQNDASQTFEDKIIEIQKKLDNDNVNPQEKIAIIKRIGEIRVEKVKLVTISNAKIRLVELILKIKKRILGIDVNLPQAGLLDTLSKLSEQMTQILTTLEQAIEAASKAGLIGLIISAILRKILDIIREKIYLPLKTTVEKLVIIKDSLNTTLPI